VDQTATHILLVEDDPAVAGSLQEGLERDGYRVTWKATGASGVSFARDHNPHLIILDIRLPDGSGFDVCRQMRQLKLRQPILMLTVQRDEVDKVLGLEMGADDYVTKPFSLRELLSRIRAQAWRGDHQLNLTPTEFRLLTFLAQYPGQALSRQQILNAVWGYAAEVESDRTVNVHIRRLREKIEPDPGSPRLILTVPGIGYRFTDGTP
jgi:DNA-binding response OmpR family regulator